MESLIQSRVAEFSGELRQEAGSWLRELREQRGLSQSELAQRVAVKYYTIISQLEHGRGRIPPDAYLVWANALGVDSRHFVWRLMSYYDPVTYEIFFGRERRKRARTPSARFGDRRSVSRIQVRS